MRFERLVRLFVSIVYHITRARTTIHAYDIVEFRQADRELKKWTCLRARTGRVARLVSRKKNNEISRLFVYL